jgi:hypothetical protein
MPDVQEFMDEAIADFRRRLALLGDCGDRRAVEDGIALLTDYRLAGMDEVTLEALLATLAGGRSPVGLQVLKPQAIGAELAQRWHAYRARGTAALTPLAVSPRTRAAIAAGAG